MTHRRDEARRGLSITDLAQRCQRRRRTYRDHLAREAREQLEAEGQLSLDLEPATRDPLVEVFD